MKTTMAATAALLIAALAGCSNPLREPAPDHYAEMGFAGDDVTGRAQAKWPDLHGAKVRVLDNGAFSYAFAEAKASFERLTNGTVERIDGGDAGSALQRAIQDKGRPAADVIYGIDNAFYGRAVQAGILEPFKPQLAHRILPEHVFFAQGGDVDAVREADWFATPVDYGYVAVNVDTRVAKDVQDLDDVRDNARRFVTSDPTTSSPGLGFLLATIATYGEEGVYDWKDYWAELFRGGVLVTQDWSTAYEQHFSAGYQSPDVVEGAEAGKGDRALVTSYTESPAYEAFFGRPKEILAVPVTAPGSTFKQVQTMAILKGTPERAAAEAWIEFTLTDEFQRLAAPFNAVYPVVQWNDPKVDPNLTYGDVDPEPGTFQPAQMDWRYIRDNLQRWLCEWTAVREGDQAGLTLCLAG